MSISIDHVLEYGFLSLYALTFLTSLIQFRKYYDTPLAFFPILLLYTLLTELLGKMILEHKSISLFVNDFYANYNWVLFNVYNLVFFGFFFYVYYRKLDRPWGIRLTWIGAACTFMAALVNPFLQHFLYESQVYAYITGGVFIILCAGLYLYQRASQGAVLFHTRDLLSWTSLGICIFYTGYIPIKVLRSISAEQGLIVPLGIKRLHHGLIVFMYLCIFLGLILIRNRKRNIPVNR